MLKALELIGFKSFADRTRLEFPPGITAVVGPNGSGKSNVVDSIKWVLGEQSVKSLRGKEMADVIFNGSSSRPPLNCAETTLTFDNSRGLLPIDTPEVHITRRVYRSGEGEYLINRQPCRLRDIRDLFSGTGAATEAYSVIEQGKVDILLQASPRDRRLIFEEAAGISRFKAKKVESLRRLERVEQNLLRLADIVEEVDNRLRTVRKQAVKASRYKEYRDRLQELRTQVGLVDWRHLGGQLAQLEGELAQLADQAGAGAAEAERLEAAVLELETSDGDLSEQIRECDVRLSGNRERIAAHESTVEHQRARCHELEAEEARYRQQLAAMGARAGDLDVQLRETRSALEEAAAHHSQIVRQSHEGQQSLSALTATLDQLRRENERRRVAHMDAMRSASALTSEISVLEAQAASLAAARHRLEQHLARSDLALEQAAGECAQLIERQHELQQAAETSRETLTKSQHELVRCRERRAQRADDLAQLRQRQSGSRERAALLEEWEARFEGIGVGAREVLQRAQHQGEGPLAEVRGLVADLLSASVETAPLVDVALGELAQYVVVSGAAAWRALLDDTSPRLSGRVGFVRLDVEPLASLVDEIELAGHRGVLGRADRLVEVPQEHRELARRLLGRTWFVEKLSHALTLSTTVGRGLSFVTLAGELVAADGHLVIGPRHASTGLVSRRSELRALEQLLAELESQIEEGVAALGDLDAEVTRCDAQVAQHETAQAEATAQLAEQRLLVTTAQGRHEQLARQRAAQEEELSATLRQCHEAQEQHVAARARLDAIEASLAQMETEIAEAARRIEQLSSEAHERAQSATEVQVRLAKSEERLQNFQAQQRQIEQHQQERRRAIADSRGHLEECAARVTEARRRILAAQSQIADLYLAKEQLAAQAVALVGQRAALRQQRSDLAAEAQRHRATVRRVEEQSHKKELAAGEIRLQRDALASRLRDDYAIELADLEHDLSPAELHEREAVEDEITELRRKLANMGSVNLEALDELSELETRFESLSTQYQDLDSAKRSLEQIIGKINADSRRLFAETLETVRGHFQELFRKLFGGGHADILLEPVMDILESGVEIVARPPGKEPRNISLLSGGEKTLTCVALLLAIFRNRPSPFCVLDEVDAALDEANIERFIRVLTEYLAWTQFIIVTHSKKTMTCANTLYGVTMQESGISKRVSVRFEDISDNGEIVLPPHRAAPAADASPDVASLEPGQDDTQAA